MNNSVSRLHDKMIPVGFVWDFNVNMTVGQSIITRSYPVITAEKVKFILHNPMSP